jgi:hypothetical protein
MFYVQPSREDAPVHGETERDDAGEPEIATEPHPSTITSSFETSLMWGDLDAMEGDLHDHGKSEQFLGKLAVGATAVSVTALTAGYVMWLVQSGSLLATILSSLPAWMSFDPLPVLDSFDEDDEHRRARLGEEDHDRDLASFLNS